MNSFPCLLELLVFILITANRTTLSASTVVHRTNTLNESLWCNTSCDWPKQGLRKGFHWPIQTNLFLTFPSSSPPLFFWFQIKAYLCTAIIPARKTQWSVKLPQAQPQRHVYLLYGVRWVFIVMGVSDTPKLRHCKALVSSVPGATTVSVCWWPLPEVIAYNCCRTALPGNPDLHEFKSAWVLCIQCQKKILEKVLHLLLYLKDKELK